MARIASVGGRASLSSTGSPSSYVTKSAKAPSDNAAQLNGEKKGAWRLKSGGTEHRFLGTHGEYSVIQRPDGNYYARILESYDLYGALDRNQWNAENKNKKFRSMDSARSYAESALKKANGPQPARKHKDIIFSVR